MNIGRSVRHAATCSRRTLSTTCRLNSSSEQREDLRRLTAFLSLSSTSPKPTKPKPPRTALPKATTVGLPKHAIAAQDEMKLSKEAHTALSAVLDTIEQASLPLPDLPAFQVILQTNPPPAGDSLVPHDYLLPWVLIFNRLFIRSCRTRSSDCFWLSIDIYRLLQFENIVNDHRQIIILILKSALSIEESDIDSKVWDAVIKLTENVGKVREPKLKGSGKNQYRSTLEKFQGQIRTPLPEKPNPFQDARSTQIVQILALVLKLLAQSPCLTETEFMSHVRSVFNRLNKQPQASNFLEESSLTHLPNSLMMSAPSVSDALEIAWWFSRLPPIRPRSPTSLVVSANILIDKTKKTNPIGPPGPLLSFWGEAGSPSLVASTKAKEGIQTLLNAYVQEIIDLVSSHGACPADHRERTLGYIKQLDQFAINVDQSVSKVKMTAKDRAEVALGEPEKKNIMEDGTWAGLMINALSWCGDYAGALEVYHRVFVLSRRSRDDLALSVALDACGYSGVPEKATKIWTTQLYARQPLSEVHTRSYLECLLRAGCFKTAATHLGSLVPPSISSRPRWPGHMALPFVQEDKLLGMMSKSLLVGRSIVEGKTKSTKFEVDGTALKEFEDALTDHLNEQGKTRLKILLKKETKAWKDSWTEEKREEERKVTNRKTRRRKRT